MLFGKHIGAMHRWYARNERLFSSISLVAGFIFDIFTLKRVDLLWENVWIAAHLLVAAIGIIVLNLFKKKEQSAIHFYLIILIQFAFGGLFSTFLVFYFRSATLATSWPFLLFLAVVFISNEVLKKQYLRVGFQVGVFFIALYAFAIYALPVVVHQIGDVVFIGSGLVSIIAVGLFLVVLRFIVPDVFFKSRISIVSSIVIILVVINTLYFAKLIPPIPLSMKDAGVFHTITRNKNGDYEVTRERRNWLRTASDYIFSDEQFHYRQGDPIYVYAAVFSPAALKTSIVHEWQYYDAESKTWQTTNQFPITIIGGRDGGYRAYSNKSSITEGLWRVNITTADGRVIGRIKFQAVEGGNVALETITKD